MSDSEPRPESRGDAPEVTRRDFLAAGTAGALALPVLGVIPAPAQEARKEGTHHVAEDKNLSKAWVERLFARGERKTYRGEELTCIGMPIGGICAGQLYLRGDGTLAGWDVANQTHNTGFGDTCYRTYTPESPLLQGFAIQLHDGKVNPSFSLERLNFPDVEFVGEYPLAWVRYGQARHAKLPVEVSLEAFSPFVPLDARSSATPGTILRYRVKNTTDQPVEASLWGWMENAIGKQQVGHARGVARSAVVRTPRMTTLLLSAEGLPPEPPPEHPEPPEVFANFEGGDYGAWKATGTAFGDRPATGTFPNQQAVTGFEGKGLVNSFVGGDDAKGTLTSPEFTIQRRFLLFRIGGGSHRGKTCINLRVFGLSTLTASGRVIPAPKEGQVVLSATGKDNERLEGRYWDVSPWKGKRAVLEIIDDQAGGWGHINVDDIQFSDTLPPGFPLARLEDQPDFGTMALSVLDGDADAVPIGYDVLRRGQSVPRDPAPSTVPLGTPSAGGVATRFRLRPGEEKEVIFLVTWHFARNEHGKAYGRWFKDALEVAAHLRENLDGLTSLTRLFHDTYYDSTLPHWLLDRLMMPVSTLATSTCHWWHDGRFWAWEGVGCCHGTCTHVWNYAQAMARLFPELERSVRTMQDLGPAFDPKTGRVAFRGEGPGFPYAADGQCGTVLKCYREHLQSADGQFLAQHWPKIKKVMEFSIQHDGNADGIIADHQHNTYDIDFVGPNTFVGALYLAALRAAARMAELQGDKDFAERCRAIAEKGSRWTVEHLWNGRYFEQEIPRGEPTRFQYGKGCLADQLFGQNWANQVDLGSLYPADLVRTALRSIYRYNWAPDVAAQNQAHPPQRWFARPGEAGLFVCTWPRGGRMDEPVLYRDEVWTGGEYQLASHLLDEGMIREGLSVVRGIHDRYDGARHNPWNEVECGDHYARALASWGCLLALSGFRYDGPAGRLAFAPRWQHDDFRAFFTGAEGWGTLHQKRSERRQRNALEIKHGRLRLRELAFDLPAGAEAKETRVEAAGRPVACQVRRDGTRVVVALEQPVVIEAEQALEAVFTF